MTRSSFPFAFVCAAFSLTLLVGCGNDTGGVAKEAASATKEAEAPSAPEVPKGVYRATFGPDQSFSLNFLDGNQVEATFREGGADQTYKTTFTSSGDTVTMNVPEGERQAGSPDSLVLKRSGEALEMTVEGVTMRFDKL